MTIFLNKVTLTDTLGWNSDISLGAHSAAYDTTEKLNYM